MRILLFLILCSLPHFASAQDGINNPGSSEKSLISVTVKPLSEVLTQRQLRTPAEVISENRATLASEVSGVIAVVNADVGQTVRKGETLLEINATDYQLALQQAQANLTSNAARIEQAEKRLQRANELSSKKYISADDLLARETELVVLKAERKGLQVAASVAQNNVHKCSIKAPFDGIVEQRMAQVGSYLLPGASLFTFVENQAIVLAQLPVHLSDSLLQASEISFSSQKTNFPLKLAQLSPVVDTALRAQKARFTFVTESALIGTSGELLWLIDTALLPSDLVVSREGQLGVFIAQQNTAVFKPLDNAQEGRPVPVNLPESTRIIVAGRQRLQDGDAIRFD